MGQPAMGQPNVPYQQSELGFGAGQQASLGLGLEQQASAPFQEQQPAIPLVDVLDSPESITVVVDLPGFDEESIQLQASGNSLHVSASRREEPSDEERPLQRERRGRIERTITLPSPINAEEAEASFEDGVCKIKLPKSEESQQKSIAFQ